MRMYVLQAIQGSTLSDAFHSPAHRLTCKCSAPRSGQYLARQRRGFAGGFADAYPGGFECLFFGLGGAGGAGNYGSGVAHGFAFRGGEAGHVADDWLADVFGDERRGALFGVAATRVSPGSVS